MATTNDQRSKVLSLAHAIVKADKVSFSAAQVSAWKAIRLIEALNASDVVEFSYTKVSDGTTRKARGTRKFDYASTSSAKVSPLTVRYYDFDANGWRSCRVGTII